jgi:hypothetical protein
MIYHMEKLAAKIAARNQHMNKIELRLMSKFTGANFNSRNCENPFEQLSFLLS